jgi:hypothetical protein
MLFDVHTAIMTASTPTINHIETNQDVRYLVANWRSRIQSIRWRLYAPLILLGIILVLTALLRMRMLSVPLERDEGEYAYFAQLILDGHLPYQYAYTMKLPGVCYAYLAGMALFGADITGIHFAFLLVNLFTITTLFLLARNFSGSFAGITAAASYAVLSADAGVLGFHAHATHYVVLFAVLGALLLERATQRKSTLLIVLSGLSMGIAFLMKQHGMFFVVFGVLWIAFAAYNTRENIKAWLTHTLLFGGASLIPYGIVCLAMWLSGVFPKFWFWTFTYARAYTGETNLHDATIALISNLREVLNGPLWIWCLGAVSLLGLLVVRRTRQRHTFVFLFALSAAAAVCPGFYFRTHYFVLFLPALALAIGIGLAELHQRLIRSTSWTLKSMPAAVLILAMGLSLYRGRAYFFQFSPAQEARFNYGADNPFPEAIPIAKYLREHTRPTDRVSILGSEPEILFYAHRLSATGHIYTYGLMESQPYARMMQREFMKETEQSVPEFVVFVPFIRSWSWSPRSVPDLWEWIPQFLSSHYDRMGIVNIEGDRTSFFWDENAQHAAPARLHIFVFRRRR